MFCNCKEKIVLKQGDSSFIACESWCPKHGYNNSCYMCSLEGNGIVFSTELCVWHRSDEFRSGYNNKYNKERLWDIYSLSISQAIRGEECNEVVIAHNKVVVYLEGHPDIAKRYLDEKDKSIRYFDVLDLAEKEI